MARLAVRRDFDNSMAVRAAWLHYAAGMTQSDVAKRLGVTSVKAHRLISRAAQNGLIKVVIDGEVAECVALEEAIASRFELSYCEVVPDLGEDGLPLRALGMAGGGYLQRAIEKHQGGVIGIGHGRTLAASVQEIPRVEAGDVRFVSLLGGLTRNYSANPHDVMHHLAAKTGATAYVMPVPFFANSVEDREVLLVQRGVSEVFDLAARADVLMVGIGNVEPGAQLVSSGMVEAFEIREVNELGAVGEMLGHFFDAEGRAVQSSLSARTISLGLDCLSRRKIVAIAGGKEKTCAIRSILMSGLLDGLITDEGTAHALMNNKLTHVGGQSGDN